MLNTKKPVKFRYKNYKGVVADRTAIPQSIEYRISEYHGSEPKYVMVAYDLDKEAIREFVLTDIEAFLEA